MKFKEYIKNGVNEKAKAKLIQLDGLGVDILKDYFNDYEVEINFNGEYHVAQTRDEPADNGYETVDFITYNGGKEICKSTDEFIIEDTISLAKLYKGKKTNALEYFAQFEKENKPDIEVFSDLCLTEDCIYFNVHSLKIDSKNINLSALADNSEALIDSAWED